LRSQAQKPTWHTYCNVIPLIVERCAGKTPNAAIGQLRLPFFVLFVRLSHEVLPVMIVYCTRGL
ncbi:MAG TPA: hypothetical protein VLW25_13685, partial [Bryobacteraceae bacterium]|nr:hypothetical protein [Bryobacteraceae bacterium]